jgi:hypothetical protein
VFTRDVEFGSETKEYFKKNYLSVINKSKHTRENQTGKVNLFAIFILRSLQLINDSGLTGSIVPNTLLRTTVYEGIRRHLLDNASIETIVDLKSGVFEGVTASTVLIFLGADRKKKEIAIIDNPAGQVEIESNANTVFKEQFENNPSYSFNIFAKGVEIELFEKMKSLSINLTDVVSVFNGIATFANKQGIGKIKINDTYKKLLVGKDIKRYHHEWHGLYIEYVDSKLQRARDENIFLSNEKLIMQRIGGILVTSYDDEQYYTFNSVNNILINEGSKYSLKFILALLNSNLLQYYYIKNFTNNSSLTVNVSKTYLDELPLVKLDFNDLVFRRKHDEILGFVGQIILLHKQKQNMKVEVLSNQAETKLDYYKDRINQLVYELYGLTEEEIRIVEGKRK